MSQKQSHQIIDSKALTQFLDKLFIMNGAEALIFKIYGIREPADGK